MVGCYLIERFWWSSPWKNISVTEQIDSFGADKCLTKLAMPKGKPTELRVTSFMLLHGKVGRSLSLFFFKFLFKTKQF